MIENPFAVISPEELDAEKANQLFVEMYSDYPQIRRPGNIIMTGARGSGKSMLIRCSLPDVLMIRKSISFPDLEYLAFLVPIRKTSLNLTDLRLLDNRHYPYLLNEHFMSIYVLMYALLELSRINIEDYDSVRYKNFYEDTYSKYLRLSGYKLNIEMDYSSSSSFFTSLYNHTLELQSEFITYIVGLDPLPESTMPRYNLPLLSFMRFIVPVFTELLNLPGFPRGKNIYLYIDDADNLSELQTRILNNWISYRTQPLVSIKVSTQYETYKTYLTTNDVLIESPHDYQTVNISMRYTTNHISNFQTRAVQILDNRLKCAGIKMTPHAFFPYYRKQEDAIRAEEKRLKENFSIQGRGNRASDDARRYAIPNYIRGLGGTKKSRSTYQYAGLDNIIHLSSGIVRNLLDATAAMYDTATNTDNKIDILSKGIPTSVQNTILREYSHNFLYTELRVTEKIEENSDQTIEAIENPKSDIEKLQNLIRAMGETFHEILVSDRAERKVFSIALSNIPSIEIRRVIKLGVRLNFLHETTIGNKEGTGRTWLYILNRKLAPSFLLDPTGFQGYLFMTNTDLLQAIKTGKRLRKIEKINDEQLQLFDYWE